MKMMNAAGGALLALLVVGCGALPEVALAPEVATTAEVRRSALGSGSGDPFGVGPLRPVRKGRADLHARIRWDDMARRATLWPPAQPQDRHFRRKKPPRHKHPQPESAPFTDSLVALVPHPEAAPGASAPLLPGDPPAPRPLSPAPTSSFLALDDNNSSIPPDTHGAVGPDHLMVALNTEVRILDRDGAEQSRVRLDDFWDELGLDAFDPRVHYDPQEDRWIFVATADAGAATSAILIGASESDDPTAGWHLFSVDADADDEVWADYPTVGFNRHWVVVDINMFTRGGNSFSSGEIFIFDKADLYAGGEGAFTQVSIGGVGTASPAVVFDPDLDDLHMLVTWNGSFNGRGFVRLYTVTGDVGDEQVDAGPFGATPNPWSFSPPGGEEIGPQLDSDDLLQTNDSRMQKVVYRNGTLWAAQTVHLPDGGAATHAAVQWWQLDPHTVQSNLMEIRQFGRIGGIEGSSHFAFPAISVNADDDAVLGYSRMAPDQHPSANYSFRLGGDAPSTMQADAVLKAGEAPYHKTFGGETNRWGDYSAAMVDPTDDTALWVLQMYASARVGDHDRWGTWWGRITPSNEPPVIGELNDQLVAEGNLLEFDVPASDPDGQVLSFSVDPLPPGASLDAETGEFSWRPGFDQAGIHELTFTVTDGTDTDEHVVTIEVVDANAPPVLDPVGDLQAGERDLLQFDLTASDDEGDALTFAADPTPDGASLDAETGRFSWTPTRAQIGEHSVELSVSDATGRDSEQITITVVDDNRGPVLQAIGDRTTDEGQALGIQLAADDGDGDALTFSADGLPEGATLGADDGRFRWTPGFDQAGEYDVTFRVEDVSLQDSDQVTITVVHVNVAPVLAAVGARRGDEAAPLSFTLDADDFDADPLTFSAQGLPAGAALDPDSGRFDWTPSFDQAGVHPVTLSVSDGALSDDEVVELTIDNVNRGPLLDSVDRQSIDEGERLRLPLVWSDPDGDAVQIRIAQGPAAARIEVAARLLIWQPGFDEAGLHEFELVATDGELERRRTFTVDVGNVNRAPTLQVDGDRVGREASEVVLDVTGRDPDGDAVFLGAPTIPVGATFDSPSGRFAWTPTFDQAGEHDVRFVVSDGALVTGIDVVLNIANTNRAPAPQPVQPQRVAEDEVLALQLVAVDPDGDAFTWVLRAPPAGVSLGENTGALAWRPTFDQAGQYRLIALASDGSDAGELAIDVTVDNVNRRPSIDPVGELSVRENEALSVQLSGSDPDGDALRFSALGLPGGATLDPDSGALAWTPTYDDSGEYPLTLTVSDGDLDASSQASITVIHVNRRPSIESPGELQGRENEPLIVELQAADPDGDRLVFSALGLPDGARLDGADGEITWTPTFDQAGDYRVSLRVHDGAVFAETTTDWRILDVNRPPTLAPVGDQRGAEGQALAFDLAGADPDGDLVRYLAEGLPAGATLDRESGAVRWTPDFEQSRVYEVRFIASDGKGGEAAEAVRLEISDVDRPPTVDRLLDRRVAEGSTLQVEVSASDPDREPVALEAELLPAGAEFDPASRSMRWTPSFDQAGEYEARFVARARQLTGTGTVRITVTDVNRPPSIEAVEALAIDEGQELKIPIVASDPDGDALELSAVTLPEGAELDAAAGEVRWTPGFDAAGEHPFAVGASDGRLSARVEFVVTAVNVNRPPTLMPPADPGLDEAPRAVVGDTLAFALIGADPDGDRLAFAMIDPPSGARLDALSGRFSWIPRAIDTGDHRLTFVVTDGEFEAELEISVEVIAANGPPQIEAIADQEVRVGQELELTLSASDPDGDTLFVKLTRRPGGLLLDMGARIIRWTPGPPQEGEHALEVVVSDGELEAKASFSITVLPARDKPAGDAAEAGGGEGLAGEDRLAPPAKGNADNCIGSVAAGPGSGPATSPSAPWAVLLLLGLAHRRRERR